MPVGTKEIIENERQLREGHILRAIHTGNTKNAMAVLTEMDRIGEDVDFQIGKLQNRTLLMEALMYLIEFESKTEMELRMNCMNYRVVLKLLEMHASTHIKDNYGENAFHHALRKPDYMTVFMMTKLAGQRNNLRIGGHQFGGMFEPRNDGYTPLHVGLKRGNEFSSMAPILNAECDQREVFNHATKNDGQTVFHFAVMYDNPEAVRAMLKHESTHNNIPDNHGETPFAMSVGKPIIHNIFLDFCYTGKREESQIFKHSFHDTNMGLRNLSNEDITENYHENTRRAVLDDDSDNDAYDSDSDAPEYDLYGAEILQHRTLIQANADLRQANADLIRENADLIRANEQLRRAAS